LHQAGRTYRPFDLYTLEHTERQWWLAGRLGGSEQEYTRRILRAYGASPLAGDSGPLHGVRGAALVHVGPVDARLTAGAVLALAQAARDVGGHELHCLAWEMEADLAGARQALSAESGMAIRVLSIPREIMEPNAGSCPFFEPGSVEARVVSDGGRVDVELLRVRPARLDRPEAEGVTRAPLDFIDFWAVDFDYREAQPFKHHWQAFRTRRDRRLATRSAAGWIYQERGPHSIAVKAIDVVGTESMAVIDVEE
jgi:adenine-specific DNA-methyltransferase